MSRCYGCDEICDTEVCEECAAAIVYGDIFDDYSDSEDSEEEEDSI